MVTTEAAMTAEELKAWMDEYVFDNELLAQALGVHWASVIRWRSGKHPINTITRLALEHLAENKSALRERQKSRLVVEQAKQQMQTGDVRSRIDAARERAVAATVR